VAASSCHSTAYKNKHKNLLTERAVLVVGGSNGIRSHRAVPHFSFEAENTWGGTYSRIRRWLQPLVEKDRERAFVVKKLPERKI
jgi:hypothetical protein